MKAILHVLLALVLATPCWLHADPGAGGPLPPARSMLEWTPEQTRVGFRKVAEIFPTRRVPHGEFVHVLPEADDGLAIRFEIDGAIHDLDSYIDAYRVTGVLVIREGAVLLERYAHGREQDDHWASFSVAKSLTSTLVGAAIRDGHIKGLDAPITRYLPELKGSAYEGVSVRQLLTMTSGVAWNEDYGDPESDVARLFATPSDEQGVSPIISYMRRLPRAQPPGERFNYSTGETELAGLLVSSATGRRLSDYLSEKIWAPFGMEDAAYWQLHEDGHETGGCCLNMTLRDYGRFGQFFLEDGRIDGVPILPEGWVEQATRPQVDLNDQQGYGFQWWTRGNTFQALGIFGQMILVDPELALVIVLNAAWPNPGDSRLRQARSAFIDAVTAEVRRTRFDRPAD